MIVTYKAYMVVLKMLPCHSFLPCGGKVVAQDIYACKLKVFFVSFYYASSFEKVKGSYWFALIVHLSKFTLLTRYLRKYLTLSSLSF